MTDSQPGDSGRRSVLYGGKVMGGKVQVAYYGAGAVRAVPLFYQVKLGPGSSRYHTLCCTSTVLYVQIKVRTSQMKVQLPPCAIKR